MTTPCIRVEKGEATDEELAALTVLLLTRATQSATGTEAHSPGATGWHPDPFHPPHSWQAP